MPDTFENEKAPEVLIASQEYIRSIIDSSLDMIIAVDINRRITEFNRAAEVTFGYKREEVMGKSVNILYADLAESAEVHHSILINGQSVREILNRRKNGEVFPTFLSSTPLHDAQGNLIGFMGISRDITEQKRIEAAEREQRSLAEALRDTAESLNSTLDPQEVLERILTNVGRVVAHDAADIMLIENRSVRVVHCHGYGELGLEDAVLNWRGVVEEIPAFRDMFTTRQPLVLADINDYPEWIDILPRWQRAFLGVPICNQEEIFGFLNLNKVTPGFFTDEHARRMRAFADQAAQAIANARLFEQEQAHLNELAGLYDLSRDLVGIDDIDAILELIPRRANEITNVTFSRLVLLEGDSLIVRMAHPIRDLDFDLQVGRREVLAAQSYCQKTFKQGAPVVLHSDNPDVSATERDYLLMDFIQSLCLVPLKAGEHTLGILQLGEMRNKEREPFNREKIRLALSIADQAASALHRAKLRKQIEQQLGRLNTLHKMGVVISSSVDKGFTLKELAAYIVNQLDVDAAAIRLYNSKTHMLEYSAGLGFRTNMIERSWLRLGEGYLGRAAYERLSFTLSNLESADDFLLRELADVEGFVSYCGVPFIAKGAIKGVLDIFHRRLFDHDPEWLHFAEMLAQAVALAIENSQLFEGLQRTNVDLALAYDATIEGWSRALDLRDKETEGHSQRVTEMSVELGRRLRLDAEAMIHLRRGALLHDIGKMGVPDYILLKPEPLSEDEWQIMRRHSEYAYQLLLPVAFLHPALDIPYCHHEKWDGTGYPRGLKGEQIPTAARIFAAADVWDALTSDRPYRAAWPEEKALAYIKEQSGKHFDPMVVEVFLQLIANREVK